MATFTYTANMATSAIANNSLSIFDVNTFGLTGAITNVSITLNGLSHTYVSDLDMLLLAPDGSTNLAFWSDALSDQDIVNGNFTISDQGATQLAPGITPVVQSGTYRPTDHGSLLEDGGDYGLVAGIDILHAGPSGGGTFANAFDGTASIGDWQLHIRDDSLEDSGRLDGFQLTITTDSNNVLLRGTGSNDTLDVIETGAGSGIFAYNQQVPVSYSGVTGFTFDGGAGNDFIAGSSGIDVLTGGQGRDVVQAGLGNDFLLVFGGDIRLGDVFDGGGGFDTIQSFNNASDFRNTTLVSVEKFEFTRTISGVPSAVFHAAQLGNGASQISTIDGNSGSDSADLLYVYMGAQTSLNLSGLSMIDFSQTNDAVIIVGDSDAETIIGTSVNDEIQGRGGNDSLNGGLGIDLLDGGDGSDTYFANVVGDAIVELNADLAIGGNDIVNFTGTSGTFILNANVERLTLGGISAINGIGNILSNTITGNTAANILNGGVDTLLDTLSGGLGNDTYIINSSNDNIVELVGGGLGDRAKASVSFVLAAGDNIEFLETTNAAGVGLIDFKGNEIAQAITGNNGVNVLKGAGGKDVLNGLGGIDTADFSDKTTAVVVILNGATAANVTVGGVVEDSVKNIENLIGGKALDTLTGDGLANILNGGADALADNLAGKLGNDTYIINSTTDNIIELAGGGTGDRAQASVSYALGAGDNIEFLETTSSIGVGAINLTGNEIAQTITGNAGANILNGGIDALVDTLIGGIGNDTYVINSTTDNITELVDGGSSDRAKASVSFTLAAGDAIEFLETTNAVGVGAINLTGNEFAQTIIGNTGANLLNGGVDAVSDTLIGGLGNDTYIINSSIDNVFENVGGGTSDRVKTSVTFSVLPGVNIEFLETTNATGVGAINLRGNEIAQTIIGNAGANFLIGEGGNDKLTGGLGVDQFFFNTALNAATNLDTITDFNVNDDRIVLEDAVFVGISTPGFALDASLFKNLTTGGPVDDTDRILYDDATGALFYDADGSNTTIARIQFATLTGSPTVTQNDFFVV